MDNELIVLRQLPIIEQQLQTVRGRVQEKVELALSMPCTEETYKDIKRMRSELSAEHKALEARRIEIKKQILQPYDEFERRYKELIGNLYTETDLQLKTRIGEVEEGLKADKSLEVIAYFHELRESLNMTDDFISWDDVKNFGGIKISLSESKKSLKGKVESFLMKVANEIQMIETLPESEEVLVEYKRFGFDATRAVREVNDRHKRIEAERQRREELEARKAQQAAAEEKVDQIINVEPEQTADTLAAPTVAPDPEADEKAQEKVFETSFRVQGTITQLKALKEFLENGGYKYEQL